MSSTQIRRHKGVGADASTNETPQGLTLEEIRYRRALALMEREFAREALTEDLERLRERMSIGQRTAGSGGSVSAMAGVASRVLSKVSYIDYFILGMSVFGTVRKVVGFFRKRRRK